MDLFSRSACIAAIEKGFKSELGQNIIPYIQSLNIPLPEVSDFINLQSLIMCEPPESIEDFIEILHSITDKLIITLGYESDVSYCIEDIAQMIEDYLKKYLPGSSKSWESSISNLNHNLSKIIDYVPNSLVEYSDLINSPPCAALAKSTPVNEFKLPETINPDLLFDEISHLKRDEDIQYIVTLLSTYEPQISSTPSTIGVYPSKISPYVRVLIENFLKNCDLPSHNAQSAPISKGSPLPIPLHLLPQHIVQSLIMNARLANTKTNNKINRTQSDPSVKNADLPLPVPPISDSKK